MEVLLDGDGVPPWKGHGTRRSIMGLRWGIPQEGHMTVEVLWTGDGYPTTPLPVWTDRYS